MWGALLGGIARATGLAAAGRWAFGRAKVEGKADPMAALTGVRARTVESPSRFDRLGQELTSGRLVNGLYSLDATSYMASRISNLAKPTFYHHVVVAVKGGPRASMTRTWQLACALAFGQMRNSVGFVSDYAIDCTWDISKKSVQITTGYQLGWQAHLGAREFIRRGPITTTVGARFPSALGPFFPAQQIRPPAPGAAGVVAGGAGGVANVDLGAAAEGFIGDVVQFAGDLVNGQAGLIVGGRPAVENPAQDVNAALLERRQALANAGLLGNFDILPDDGRVILTELKTNPEVQPPRPADYGDLVSLVANALTDPGFLPTAPPDGPRDGDADGLRFHAPGETVKESLLNGRIIKFDPLGAGALLQGFALLGGQGLGRLLQFFGIDGYVKRGRGQTVPAIQGPQHEERIP